MKKFNKKTIILILYILITLIVVSVPLKNKGTPIGDDYGFHFARIQGICDGLKSGIFPVKISGTAANSYGYGSGLFYCNLFLYFPAILKLLAIPGEYVIKIFMFLATISMFATTFLSYKHITKNKMASAIVATLVVTSFYFMVNLYSRIAIGEYLGMIFLPLVIAGMWDFIYNDFKKPIFIVLGMTGIIFSHILTVVIALVFCIFFTIINLKKVIFNKSNILKMLLCIFVVAMLTMAFWAPMLEQLMSQKFQFQASTLRHTYDVSINLKDVFNNKKENGIFSFGYMQSIIFIINIIFGILYWKKLERFDKQLYVMNILSIFLVVCGTFWKVVKIFDIIQFPFRLYGIATILNSMMFAKMILVNFDKNDLVKVAVIILIATSFIFLKEIDLLKQYAELPENYNELPCSLGGGKEYLPQNTLIKDGMEIDYSKLNASNMAISDSKNEINGTKGNLYFEFENNENDKTYQIPLFYYKGYKAKLISKDGEKNLNVKLGKDGLVEIENINEKGKIIVCYEDTLIQKISYIVTILTIIILCFFYIIGKCFALPII